MGAGFAGTALAIRLLKEGSLAPTSRPARITLIDPRPGDFLDYLKSQGIHASPGD